MTEKSQVREKVELQILGMTCANCAANIEKKLNSQVGVSANVNFATERAQIQISDHRIQVRDLLKIIHESGYEGIDLEGQAAESLIEEKSRNEYVQLKIKFLISMALALPFFVEMILMVFDIHDWMIPRAYQWLLATPVQFWIGWRFYRGAFYSLRSGSSNMDVLVALGTTTAYLLSAYVTLLNKVEQHVYFEASVSVITLVLMGKLLESRAKNKTAESVKNLLRLQPQVAKGF